jgi:hypothetical protein
MRRGLLVAALLAVPALGACGGNEVEDARAAATRYVTEFGERDGAGVCEQMTEDLQARAVRIFAAADPQLRRVSCERLMQRQLDAIPADQLTLFADAEIRDVKVDGDEGTFRYEVGPTPQIPNEINIDGRVAKEDDEWKVSCCLPGQSGG